MTTSKAARTKQRLEDHGNKFEQAPEWIQEMSRNPVQVALRRERRARKTAQRNARELQKKNASLRQHAARLQQQIKHLEEEKNR